MRNCFPTLRKSIKQAYLGSETFEQIVSHLQKVLELKTSEAPEEMQLNTVTKKATHQNPGKRK